VVDSRSDLAVFFFLTGGPDDGDEAPKEDENPESCRKQEHEHVGRLASARIRSSPTARIRLTEKDAMQNHPSLNAFDVGSDELAQHTVVVIVRRATDGSRGNGKDEGVHTGVVDLEDIDRDGGKGKVGVVVNPGKGLFHLFDL
jgi:hypothetical protein